MMMMMMMMRASDQSWTWVGSIHGLGWVGLGWVGLGLVFLFFVWVGLGWVEKLPVLNFVLYLFTGIMTIQLIVIGVKVRFRSRNIAQRDSRL